MSQSDANLLHDFGGVPDVDVLIERGRSQQSRVRGEGERVDGGGMETPLSVDDLCMRVGVPEDDVAVLAGGGEVLAIGGEGNGRDLAGVASKSGGLGQRVSSDLEDVDFLVFTTDGGGLAIGGQGHGGGRPGDGDGGDGSVAADQLDGLHGDTDGQVLVVKVGGDAASGRVGADARARLALTEGGNTKGVVHASGVDVGAIDGQGGDLVGVASTGVHGGGGVLDAPADLGGVVRAGVEGVGGGVVGQGGDEVHVAVDGLNELASSGVEVVQVAVETDGDEVAALPDAAELLVIDASAELKGGDGLAGLHIPDLAGAVSGGSQDLLGVRVPADAVDAALVVGVELANLVAGLAIEEDGELVLADGDDAVAVGGEANAVDEAGMAVDGLLPLEGRALEPAEGEILGTGHETVRTGLFDIDRGDQLGVTSDLTHRGTAIHEEGSTELLATISDGNDTLGVFGPGDIVDAARERALVELDAEHTRLSGVPDTNVTHLITAGNVETAGGVTGNGGGLGVLSVGVRKQRLFDVANHNTVSSAIQNVLALGITTNQDRLSTSHMRNTGINID